MTTAEAHDVALAAPRPTLLRRAVADTPRQLRTLSVALAVATVALGSLTAWMIRDRADATARVRDESGPLLISTQELASSLAEADGAATSAFLSGQVEDRDQRRSYDDTIARIALLLETSARTGGDDSATHDLIADVQARTVVYAAMVERARALHELGDLSALATLQQAATYRADRLAPTVDALASRSSDRLDDDVAGATGANGLARLAVTGMLVCTLAASWWLARRFRRIVNLPLAFATLLILALVVWTVVATSRQRGDLAAARDHALSAVVALGGTREAAYRLQTDLTTRLLADGRVPGNLAQQRAVLAARPLTSGDADGARAGDPPSFDGLLAALVGHPRDPAGRALAAETLVRWSRYDAVLGRLADQTDTASAIQLVSGDGNEAFTGFNVTIDALLAADRDVFVNDVARGADRFGHLAIAALIASLVAAMAGVAGVAQRAREYR